MRVIEFIKNCSDSIEQNCKKYLPTPVVTIGGHIYTYLSFREKDVDENKAFYIVRESVATLAKAYFLKAVVTFTLISLKNSLSFLGSLIICGTIFFIARSDEVTNLFAKFKRSQGVV